MAQKGKNNNEHQRQYWHRDEKNQEKKNIVVNNIKE